MLIYQRVGRVRESRAGEAFKRIRSFLIFFPVHVAILWARNFKKRLYEIWIALDTLAML